MSIMSNDDASVSMSIRFVDSPTVTNVTMYSIDESEEETLRKMKSPNKYWTLETRPTQEFVTGSYYKGLWNVLGMHSSGKFNFFYGPRNESFMFDNMFDGPGTLNYPNKSKMEGMWEKGHMISHRYFYPDELCFGPYCQMPDRSFILERRFGLKPAGRSLQINSLQPREIPPGCYDTVDGFYDPKKKYVFDRNDPKRIVRIPTKYEHFWILKHCRKAWDEPAEFRPDIFENWYRIKQRKPVQKEVESKLVRKAKTRFQTSLETCNSKSTSLEINLTM